MEGASNLQINKTLHFAANGGSETTPRPESVHSLQVRGCRESMATADIQAAADRGYFLHSGRQQRAHFDQCYIEDEWGLSRAAKSLHDHYSAGKERVTELSECGTQKAIQSNDLALRTVLRLLSGSTRCPENNARTDKTNDGSDNIPLIRAMAFHTP